jgi:hypothetical protein
MAYGNGLNSTWAFKSGFNSILYLGDTGLFSSLTGTSKFVYFNSSG